MADRILGATFVNLGHLYLGRGTRAGADQLGSRAIRDYHPISLWDQPRGQGRDRGISYISSLYLVILAFALSLRPGRRLVPGKARAALPLSSGDTLLKRLASKVTDTPPAVKPVTSHHPCTQAQSSAIFRATGRLHCKVAIDLQFIVDQTRQGGGRSGI